MLAWNQNTFALWFLSDSYKTWSITEDDYRAIAVISSDESVDHRFPLQLIEPVPQHNVKGFCCISQETQNQHHNRFQAWTDLWGTVQERRSINIVLNEFGVSKCLLTINSHDKLDLVALQWSYHTASLLYILNGSWSDSLNAVSVYSFRANLQKYLKKIQEASHTV